MSGATSASQLLDLQHSKWILDLLGPVKAAALTYPHTATCHTAATQQPLRKAKVTAIAFGSVTWWVPVVCPSAKIQQTCEDPKLVCGAPVVSPSRGKGSTYSFVKNKCIFF